MVQLAEAGSETGEEAGYVFSVPDRRADASSSRSDTAFDDERAGRTDHISAERLLDQAATWRPLWKSDRAL